MMFLQEIINYDIIVGLYFFILGIVIGSFLNVCVYRIPIGKSIVFPGSSCTSCQTKLKPIDLIPVFSWLFLRGRCRYCSEKISARYVLIELLNGLLYLLLYLKLGLTFEFVASAYFTSLMIIVFVIDLEHMIIPNKIVIAGIVGGIPVISYNSFYSYKIYLNSSFWNPIIAAVASFVLLLLIALISIIIYKGSSGLGMGDVKIFVPIGLFLGLEYTGLCLLLASVIGSVVGIFLIITKRKNRKSPIPFGPFIALSVVIIFFFGENIFKFLYL